MRIDPKLKDRKYLQNLISNMTVPQFYDWYDTTFGPYQGKISSDILPRNGEEAIRKAGYKGPLEGPGITIAEGLLRFLGALLGLVVTTALLKLIQAAIKALQAIGFPGVGIQGPEGEEEVDTLTTKIRENKKMDKKELKAIILKTLEKEGGAAGIKALTKASKTSKGKLKKALAKMTGVKQHQDGDYISTPISEEKTIKGVHKGPTPNSQYCECHITENGVTTIQLVYCSAKYCNKDVCCHPDYLGRTKTPTDMDMDMMDINPMTGTGPTNPTDMDRGMDMEMDKPMRLREAEEYVGTYSGAAIFCGKCPCGCSEVIEDYQPAGGGNATYAKCKSPCTDQDTTSGAVKIVDPRDPRKPMRRLREVKEIIETMLDEKKKKKKDRCHRKADQVYGTKTSAYKSGAIVKCRKGMIWKKK